MATHVSLHKRELKGLTNTNTTPVENQPLYSILKPGSVWYMIAMGDLVASGALAFWV
jgi:hypothetical protein